MSLLDAASQFGVVPNRIFTPAVFSDAKDVHDRARASTAALRNQLEMRTAEAAMRRTIIGEQEDAVRAAELKQRAQVIADQPLVLEELSKIDPVDEDAILRINELETMAVDPDTRRRLGGLRAAATMMLQERNRLADRLAVVSDPEEARQIMDRAAEEVRNGNPSGFRMAGARLPTTYQAERERQDHLRERREFVERLGLSMPAEKIAEALAPVDAAYDRNDKLAYRKALALVPTYNDVSAANAARMRSQEQSVKQRAEAMEELRKVGLTTADVADEATFRKKLIAKAAPLSTVLPEVTPEEFADDPEAAAAKAIAAISADERGNNVALSRQIQTIAEQARQAHTARSGALQISQQRVAELFGRAPQTPLAPRAPSVLDPGAIIREALSGK